MYIYIYIYIYIFSRLLRFRSRPCPRTRRPARCPSASPQITTMIMLIIRLLPINVSNQNNVYSTLNNWCTCINISCGPCALSDPYGQFS